MHPGHYYRIGWIGSGVGTFRAQVGDSCGRCQRECRPVTRTGHEVTSVGDSPVSPTMLTSHEARGEVLALRCCWRPLHGAGGRGAGRW